MKVVIVKEPYEFADFIDAISEYSTESGTDELDNMIIHCPTKMIPTVRKALGANIMYVEQDIRTYGHYIGTVLTVPMVRDDIAEDIIIVKKD